MNVRRLLALVRPAEWAVLLYVGLSAAWLWWRDGFSAMHGGEFDVRSRQVLVVLCIVGTLILGRNYWRSTRPTPERWRVPLLIAFAVCVLPGLVAIWARVNDPIWNKWPGFDVADRLYQVGMTFVLVGGVATPTLALWFFVARALRERSEVTAGALVREGVRELLSSLREWWPLLTMISSYWLMDEIIGAPANGGYDPVMRGIDRVLGLGHEPVLLLERIVNVPLSEWCAFSYTFYAFEYPLCVGAIYAVGGRFALREVVTALTIAIGLTFVSYMVFPVKGPVLTMTFEVPLDLYLNAATKEMLMDRARITWDCFPSLHTAGSLIMSWGCYRHARRLFWVTLPMIATIPFACVYLRYHYVIDVLAGAALAAAMMWLTPRLLRGSPADASRSASA